MPYLGHGGSHKVIPYGFIHSRDAKEVQGVQVVEYLIRTRVIQEVFTSRPGGTHLDAQFNRKISKGATLDLLFSLAHAYSLRLGAVDGFLGTLLSLRHDWCPRLETRRCQETTNMSWNEPRDGNCRVRQFAGTLTESI